jgi:hypothetical protein
MKTHQEKWEDIIKEYIKFLTPEEKKELEDYDDKGDY